MKKIMIIGCGNLGTTIARGVNAFLGENYQITGVYDGCETRAQRLSGELKIPILSSLEEIVDGKPDYVVEAASREVVAELAPELIGAGIDMIILSVGALVDDALVEKIDRAGRNSGARLYVASGAVGGFDLMRAVRFGGLDDVEIHTSKNPRSLQGAPYLEGKELPEDQELLVFEGSSREAIHGFPKNVNVSVSTALATLGVDHTQVKISSVPGAETNTHRIRMRGEFGDIEIRVAVRPSAENPKSSSMAAWSVLALLQKFAQTICF